MASTSLFDKYCILFSENWTRFRVMMLWMAYSSSIEKFIRDLRLFRLIAWRVSASWPVTSWLLCWSKTMLLDRALFGRMPKKLLLVVEPRGWRRGASSCSLLMGLWLNLAVSSRVLLLLFKVWLVYLSTCAIGDMNLLPLLLSSFKSWVNLRCWESAVFCKASALLFKLSFCRAEKECMMLLPDLLMDGSIMLWN